MPTQSQQAVRHDGGYTDPQAPAGYDTDPLVELARIVSEGPVFGGRHAPAVEAPVKETPVNEARANEAPPVAPAIAPTVEARPAAAAAAPAAHVPADPVPAEPPRAEPVFEAVPEPVATAPEVAAYRAPERVEPEYSPADLSRELEAELMGDPSHAVAAEAAPADASDAETGRAQSEYEQELHRQYLEQQAAYEAELAAYNAAIAAMKAQAGGVAAETGSDAVPADTAPAVAGPSDANIVDLGQSMADLSAKRAVAGQPGPQQEPAPQPVAAAAVAADEFDPDFHYDLSGLAAATPAPDMDMTVEGEKPDDERSGRGLLVAASIVGILLLGGASYAGYRALAGAAGPQEPRIIRADGGDFKRYPEADGATKTTGKSEMARLEGGAKGPERLVSREETPVRTVPTTETGGDGGTMAGGAKEGSPSRTVRTFVVRPDGSFTSKKMLPTTVTSSGKNAVIRTVSVRTVETGGSSGADSTGSVIISSKTGAPLIKAPARTTKAGEGGDTAVTVETGSSSDEAGDTGGTEPRTMTTTSESGSGSTRPGTIRDVLKRPMTRPGEGSTETRKTATMSSGDDTETESGTSTASSDDGDTETATETKSETVTTTTRKAAAAKPTRKTRSTSASTGTDPLPVRRVRTTRTTRVEKPANAPLSLLPDSTSTSTKTRRTTTRTASAAPTSTSTATSATTAAETGSGAYMVQIVSRQSEDTARSSYSDLQRKYPRELGNQAPIIRRAEVGSRGVYYRVYIGRFERAEAYRICGNLKNAGGDCLVKRR